MTQAEAEVGPLNRWQWHSITHHHFWTLLLRIIFGGWFKHWHWHTDQIEHSRGQHLLYWDVLLTPVLINPDSLILTKPSLNWHFDPNVNFRPDFELKCEFCGPKFKCQGNSRYHRGVCNTIKGGEMLELECCKVFWCFGEYHHSPAPSPSSVYNELYKYST